MKRFYSILLTLCVSSMLSAQLSIWDGTDDVWTKGAGTESSPYLIESAQQLAFIASMVNGGVTTYENTYFKLMTNIDLNNLTWVPIGKSETKCFKGHLDGNKKTIFGTSNSLFGVCINATLYRIYVESKGLASSANNCIFENCCYKGNKVMVSNATNTRFINCSSNNKIKDEYVSIGAGMVAQATNCEFIGCNVSGYIKSGYKESTTLERDENSFVGGFVGKSTRCKYIQCSCSADVYAWGGERMYKAIYNFGFSGGIVGLSVRDTFNYCNTLGDITARTERSYGGAGGITGITSNYDTLRCYIKNSFTRNSSLYYVATNGNYASVSNILTHYTGSSTGTARVSNSYTSADKTEQAMKSASFPIILNTDSTVFIKDITPNVNNGYPIYVDQVYSVTDTLSTIGFTTAQLLGHYYALNADSVGFEYKEASDNTHWYKSIAGQVSGNIITCDLTELTVGTNYVYRVWVERNGVRYFGDVLSFKTLECNKAITPLAASICQGEEYTFNGQQLTQSGAYRDTLVATNGCDSIIELTLTVMPTANIDKYDTIMVGESYDFYGDILTESGNYEHYVPMVNRCNLIILHLYVRQPNVTLTVNVNDPLMGSAEGSGSFEKYTKRTIKAVPNDGYHFIQWNDGNTDNPRIISLTQDTTFTAQFAINQYSISVTCNPQQGFIEGESGTFNHGTELTYKANANEGYHFVQWNDGAKDNPRTIVITKETTLSAEFALDTYTLSVTCNTAQGRISGTSGVFEHGTSHNFEAIPNTGYHFIQWSDEVVDNPRTIILTQDSILSAEFAKNKYLVQFFGFNDALLDSQSIEHGTAAVAPEVPIIDHYDFVGWDKEFTNVISDLDVFAIYQENTEAIENVDVSIYPKKIMIDGQIFILRGEKIYSVTGQEVK